MDYDITDQGLIVGTRMWYEGVILSALEPPVPFRATLDGTAYDTVGYGIAADGRVAGTYLLPYGLERGYLRDSDGSLLTLTFPSDARTAITGINDNGVLVGLYYDPESSYLRTRGFIATPVSEPGSLALLGVAVAAAAWTRRRWF